MAALHQSVLRHTVVMRLPYPFWDGLLSPDGSTVIAFGEDETAEEELLAAFDVDTGEKLWEIAPPGGAFGGDFSTTGQFFFIPESDGEEVSPGEQAIHAIDVATKEIEVFPVATEYLLLDIISNGSRTIDPGLFAVHGEAEDGEVILRVSLPDGSAELVALYDAHACCGSWSTDERVSRLAFGVSEETVILDLDTGDQTVVGPAADFSSNSVLSPDGEQVVTTGYVRNDVWNIERQTLLHSSDRHH